MDDTIGTAVDSASIKDLNETEKVAVQIARSFGRVTKKELMERAGVEKMEATETLKRLAEKGLLE